MTNHPALSPSLQRALTASVLNGTFNDTAFYLLSRHAADGKASTPRVVFGSSTVMNASTEYFKNSMSLSCLPCSPNLIVTSPSVEFEGWLSSDVRLPEDSQDYDYDADSDLDEDEELEEIDDMVSELSSVSSISSCPTVTEKPAGPEAYAKDEKDEQEGGAKAPTTASVEIDPAANARYKVFIPNVAATTWRALICFIYTGEVYFAPLRSNPKNARRLAHKQHSYDFPDGIPLCSPKSMYRLAEIVGLNDLKDFAEKAIKENLSESCIVEEVFSSFSASHPEILAKQLEYLYEGGRLARVIPHVRKIVREALRGDLPHAGAALDLLLTKLSETLPPSGSTPSASTSPPEGPPTAPAVPSDDTPERPVTPTLLSHDSNPAAPVPLESHSDSPTFPSSKKPKRKFTQRARRDKKHMFSPPSTSSPASIESSLDSASPTDSCGAAAASSQLPTERTDSPNLVEPTSSQTAVPPHYPTTLSTAAVDHPTTKVEAKPVEQPEDEKTVASTPLLSDNPASLAGKASVDDTTSTGTSSALHLPAPTAPLLPVHTPEQHPNHPSGSDVPSSSGQTGDRELKVDVNRSAVNIQTYETMAAVKGRVCRHGDDLDKCGTPVCKKKARRLRKAGLCLVEAVEGDDAVLM